MTYFSAYRAPRYVLVLCVIAFLIRAGTLSFGILPYERYKQPDSGDYHLGALCLALGYGMTRPDIGEPITWRTPGYPLFLAPFYTHYGVTSAEFSGNKTAQHIALWVQISICSLLPALFYLLAYVVTSSTIVSITAAIVATVHIGYVLASTYLLSDAIAALFFIIFLIFFYAAAFNQPRRTFLILTGAVLSLSIFTWMRPMGFAVGCACAIFYSTFALYKLNRRVTHAAFFFILFFLSLLPWCIRNYKLMRTFSFWPSTGIYLSSFCAPKIRARMENIPHLEAFQKTQRDAGYALHQEQKRLAGTKIHPSPSICVDVALPYIQAHPLWFAYDWMIECIKTTGDLYGSQLVAFCENTFWYDPLCEVLIEKFKDCLYKKSIPWYMRLIIIGELIGSILLWIGLLGGIWRYIILPYVSRTPDYRMMHIWIMSALICCLIIGMTGGFGYARLRLPFEPLMIILSLYWWLTKNHTPDS